MARAGDCVACHSVPGGKAFAGGLKLGSPVGNIYSTNITPDPETGIGGYSLDDFDRAVRLGVAKDGHRLYPAMPYPSYAKLTDDDVKALYDFFTKEVPPVHQANHANEIPYWLSFRWPLMIWNVIFTDSGTYAAKSGHDAAWNRGAYLVQGLEHCGACHTPRGWAFQEKALDESSAQPILAGRGDLDAWSAPNLHGDLRTGLGQWSQADVAEFLKTGHNKDGTAFGSMLDVVNNSTPYLTDDDINAMAVYLKSLPAEAHSQSRLCADDKATTQAPEERPSDTQTGARALCSGNCVVVPRQRRPRLWTHSICAAPRRQSDRARQRSVLAHQSRAERVDAARGEGNAGCLSHAAIPAAAHRSGDRGRRDLHPGRLGQRGATRDGPAGGDAPASDRPEQRPGHRPAHALAGFAATASSARAWPPPVPPLFPPVPVGRELGCRSGADGPSDRRGPCGCRDCRR